MRVNNCKLQAGLNREFGILQTKNLVKDIKNY